RKVPTNLTHLENEKPEPISKPGSSMQTSLNLDDLDELFGVI
ncbi:3750_t:CDS:1, partial [Dentiscutata erythropus]